MSKCGLTVTGTRTRYECFLRQLKSYGLVVYNTLHLLFYMTGSAADIRTSIHHKLQGPTAQEQFTLAVSTKCLDINHVIHSTLMPYIHLMGLEQRYVTLDRDVKTINYVPALWTFFTRIIYERPGLLLPDSLEGESVLYIQESFQWFISEQVKIVRQS